MKEVIIQEILDKIKNESPLEMIVSRECTIDNLFTDYTFSRFAYGYLSNEYSKGNVFAREIIEEYNLKSLTQNKPI